MNTLGIALVVGLQACSHLRFNWLPRLPSLDRLWDFVGLLSHACASSLTARSSSPGAIVAHTGSVGASLLVWLFSGLLGWTGASSFAELGSAIPLDGGIQTYLGYTYGPLASFLYSWTAIIALKPGKSVPFFPTVRLTCLANLARRVAVHCLIYFLLYYSLKYYNTIKLYSKQFSMQIYSNLPD